MNTPNVCKAKEIYKTGSLTESNGVWIPARPLGYQGLFIFKRLKAAYNVFIGKYDALDWE